MKKFENDLLAMNLQFFADGDEAGEVEGVNETDTADQSETAEIEDTGSESVTEEVAEPQIQSNEVNAAFANMRRRAEAAEREKAELDALFARQYGNLVNPETNKPIRSAKDYYEALAAQERMNARADMQQKGIDPSVIDNMIANSPAVRQAQAATAELNNFRAQQLMEEDFREVLKLDHSLSTVDDIVNDPSYAAVVDYVQRVPGIRFSDAYKIVNFDKLSAAKGEATKQATINSVKSKNHLATGAAVNVNEGGEDIPANLVESYKELFPDKSMKELRALYNKTISNRG